MTSVLGIFREIENWQGAPDPRRRGTAGPVFVQTVARSRTGRGGAAGGCERGRHSDLRQPEWRDDGGGRRLRFHRCPHP